MYLPLLLANRVIAVSEACRNDIVGAHRRLDRRVWVAVNPSFAVREPLPVRPGAERAIVVMGRISARKGLGVLMEALGNPQLARLHPVVHVCGAPYRSPAAQQFASSVEERAAALDSEVQFHGYVPTDEALTMGGIVVVPSTEADPCPLVVAEAMTAGRAVVATSCGGIPEIAGGAALLVPAGSADALAASLACVVADPAERRKLEKASLSRAKTLSAATYLAEMDALIRVLMDGRQGTADILGAAPKSR